ncbi:CotH kinase family protein [Myxococcota bacterium]
MSDNGWEGGLFGTVALFTAVACSNAGLSEYLTEWGLGGHDLIPEHPGGGNPRIRGVEWLGTEVPSSVPVTETTTSFGPPETVFERDHLIELRVDMDPADWEALSSEGMGIREFLFPASGYPERPPYTHFSATVTIDGTQYKNVDIRKKGYIGSLTVIRPALKLEFSGDSERPLASGLRRMTLNNNLEDPSRVRQCLTYDLFAEVGIVAPRCNFAHVVVNGIDFGIYSHIEPVTQSMLARHFSNADGNLYEGEFADFNPETAEHLQLKTNKKENDREDVQTVLDALASSDEEVVAALGRVVDLDSFFDFWALETLMGHWDGYSGSANNYYAYHDPTSGKFFFIPWGTDTAFLGQDPNSDGPYEITVYANGAIANRLYALPSQRERFRARLAQLNDGLWDVPALLERVRALRGLAPDASRSHLARLRSFIRSHGDDLRAALAQSAPDWPEPVAPPADACLGMASEVAASFDTQWGLASDAVEVSTQAPEAAVSVALDGSPFDGAFRARAGEDLEDLEDLVQLAADEVASIRLGAPRGDGWYVVIDLVIPIELFEPGYHPFHSIETIGRLGLHHPEQGLVTVGVIGDGGVQLDAASLEPGHPVSGTFHGAVSQFLCVATVTEPP